jgi:hypothetical protein
MLPTFQILISRLRLLKVEHAIQRRRKLNILLLEEAPYRVEISPRANSNAPAKKITR